MVLHADEAGTVARVAESASATCSAQKLEQPNSRTVPSATSSSSAPIVSATGVLGSGACSWYRSMRSVPTGAGCPPPPGGRRPGRRHPHGPRRARRTWWPARSRHAGRPGLPQVRLALGAAVDVGGVEQGDAGVEAASDHGVGLRRHRSGRRSCCSRARPRTPSTTRSSRLHPPTSPVARPATRCGLPADSVPAATRRRLGSGRPGARREETGWRQAQWT